MTISFNDIPAATRRPWAWIEFDPSKAQQGPSVMEHKILVVGVRNAGGATAVHVPKVATSADQVAGLFGTNSMLVGQAAALFENNKVTQATFIGINAPGGGAASVGSWAISGPATAAGTYVAYLGGKRFAVAVASGDTATVIGDALVALINADQEIPWTAANVTGTVTVTAAHVGAWGNEHYIDTNYYSDEAYPAGVTTITVQPAGGSGTLDPSAIWAVLGDTHYTHIALPDLGTADLLAVETELADRWGPERQVDGQSYSGLNDTFANLSTTGSARNSPHSTLVGSNKSPTPTYKWAAALCGLAANNLAIDPARPLQTLELKGVLPPKANNAFTKAERNLLLFDGISIFDVSSDGRVILERVITTYQTNSFGAADTAYLDLNTKATLSYLRFSFRNLWQRKYPRHKLRSDGSNIPPGQAILTPKTAKAEIVAWFRSMEDLGLVENVDQFKRDLIVERNATDPNRLDIQMSPDVVNQLRVLGMQIAFLL